jgi:hypothetical protein
MKEPLLAATTIKPNYSRVNLTVRVIGGLHYIKGNSLPYFSLTKEEHRKGFPNQCQSFGCDHETILKYFPKFADLAALHLSDIDGVPMHAEGNGWYNLAGALSENGGQQYHVGNSQRHFPKPEGAERRGEWDNTDYRYPTQDEALAIFAEYVRTDIETAKTLRDYIVARFDERIAHENNRPESERRSRQEVWKIVRDEYFRPWIEAQKTRWKNEADACIAKHDLKIYGDSFTR